MQLIPFVKCFEFGELKIFKVYFYYEGPQLLCAIDINQNKYICMVIDKKDEIETWVFLPVSEKRLQDLKNNVITLRNAFFSPEKNLYKVIIRENDDVKVSIIDPSKLNNKELPDEDYYLD